MSFFLIKSITSSEPLIRIHKKTAERFGIVQKRRIRISYGIRQDEGWVSITNNIPDDVIEIDQSIIDYLRIDTSFRYDCHFHKDKLVIGPVIGLLFWYKGRNLKKRLQKNIDRYLPYIRLSNKIGGLMYFFAADQINFEKEEITGYIYELDTSSWKRRVLPFPGAIFRRISVSKKLRAKMRGKILNSYRFNKADFWRMIRHHPKLKHYLPETIIEISKNNLDKLLKRFGNVFLKHTKKSLGRGIFLISKKENGYIVRKNYEEDDIYMSEHEMKGFLRQHKNNHILQQAIQLKTYANRKIDYRVILVKDLNDKWQCMGIIGWLGDINGITIHTLVETNGKKVEDMLKLQFSHNSKQVEKKKNELIKAGIELACVLDDQAGPYSDFGFDIGFDINEKLWVFEANVCQDLKCPLWIDDYGMYEKIIRNIIKYIKKIAMS